MLAQNLVLNPSFEEKIECPHFETADTGNLHIAKYWHSPGKTSDYYNACANNNNIIDAKSDVPKNVMGYQYAHTGDGYAGIILMDSSANNLLYTVWREYAEGTLVAPLEKDSIYKVRFYISMADDYSTRATDRIGAYFHQQFITPTVYYPGTPFLINAKPQVENMHNRILYDTAHWTQVCGFFRAKGGESYLTIGNFYDDQHTPFIQTGPNFRGTSYYYLDDVSVEKVPQHLSPYNFVDQSIICNADSISNYQVPDNLSYILWSTGDTTHQAAIPGAGQFWVRAMLDECLFTDTFNIKYVPPPKFSFAEDSAKVCSTALPLALHTDDCCADILWSTGDTTITTSISQPGWTWIEESNVCGTLRDSFYLTVAELPDLHLGQDTALCDTPPFLRTLSASAGMDSYQWNTGDTTSFITITQPGQYWVEVQNVCGQFRDTILIKDLRNDQLHLIQDTSLCLIKPLVLQVPTMFDTYNWNTGEHSSQIEIQDYGTYYLTVTNACGTQSDSVNISESNSPNLTLPLPLALYLGDSIQLLPIVMHDKPVHYVWESNPYLNCVDCAEPFVQPFVSSIFRLTVTDSLGCSAMASIPITVLETQRIYLPNVFSPNDDTQNDQLVVYFGGEVQEVLSVLVLDRWGEIMTEKSNVFVEQCLEIWDGTYRNKPAAPGVYVLMLEVRLLDGRIVRRVADVTLVR